MALLQLTLLGMLVAYGSCGIKGCGNFSVGEYEAGDTCYS